MSRPVVLMTFSLLAGILVADSLFYDFLQVPTWLHYASWGLCLFIAVLSIIIYYREKRTALLIRTSLFPLLTVIFFFTLGLERYAVIAERQQAWPVEEWVRGNPDEFDAKRWRWVNGVPPKTLSGAKKEGTIQQLFIQCRERVVRQLSALDIDHETLSVMMAMTLGDRSQLPRETRDLYSQVGASHLLALSGLHLGIIVGLFLTWINGPLLLSRWRRFVGVLVLIFIWTYTLMVGMPASLLRAAMMTSLFVIGSLLQRYTSALQYLMLTALIMLLWRPMMLFEVGAQLSFLAVAGILLFYRPLYMWFFDRWRYQIFWLERYHLLWPFTTLAVSLCAQLLTWPLVAYYFHQIPTYGTLLSIILIPLTTLFLYLSLGVIALSWIWPLGATWLSGGLSWLMALQLWLMSHVSRWPGAVIPDFWDRKAEPQVVVYHNRRCPALHVIASPSKSWLLTPEPDSLQQGMYYIRRDFWKRRLTKDPTVLRGSDVINIDGALTAMMIEKGTLTDAAAEYVATHKDRQVDVAWIVRGFRGGRLDELEKIIQPRLLVLDASLARWQRNALRREALRRGWRVYDVAAQGALVMKLEQRQP